MSADRILVIPLLVLALAAALPAASVGQQLTLGDWQPKQGWQKEGDFWLREGEGAEAVVRLQKAPCVLVASAPLDATTTAIRASVPLRIEDLQTGDRWEAVSVACHVVDNAGEPLEKARKFLRADTDWSAEVFDLPVPDLAVRLEVIVEFRGKAGRAEVRSPEIEVTAVGSREMPERRVASAEARAGGDGGIPADYVVPWQETEDPSAWGADIDESLVQQVLHVDPAAEAEAADGTAERPFATAGAALDAAAKLLHAGTATRLLLRPGVYHEHNLRIDGAKIGGQAVETLLVIEAEAPETVFFRASETAGFEPETWELVDAERQIYKHPWPWNGMQGVDPDGYQPATGALSRRSEMVFVDGTWLRPVMIEGYRHEVDYQMVFNDQNVRVGQKTLVKDIHLGFRDPRETLEPGQFGVADLGPGEPDYDGHPDPNTIFLRLPAGMEGLEGRRIEVSRGGRGGLRVDDKHNLVLRNLAFEHYGIAAVRVTGGRNLLLENCHLRYNDGSGGACALRIRRTGYVTVRDSDIRWNGPFGLHANVVNARFENVNIERNNWRGGLTYHALHGNGGASISGERILFRDCHFDRNFGMGARQDGSGVHLVFERCSFNQNEMNGGLMCEITVGPILVEDCELLGNERFGLHVNTTHNLHLRDTVIANNGGTQIELFPMPNRGKQFIPGKVFGGTLSGFDEDFEPIRVPGGAPIIGIQHLELRDCVIASEHSDGVLIHWQYWGNNEQQYLDSVAMMRAGGNTYWHAAGQEVFGGGGKDHNEGRYRDLAAWRQFVGQDADSTWERPEGIGITGITERIGITEGELREVWDQ